MKRRHALLSISLLPFGRWLPLVEQSQPKSIYPSRFIVLTRDVHYGDQVWSTGLILERNSSGQYAPLRACVGDPCIGCIELITRDCWEPLATIVKLGGAK